MLDKGKFIEMLTSIVEIAKTQENTISQDEIKQYFSDIELEEEHYDHIYQYLSENNIKVKGFLYVPKQQGAEEKEQEDSEESKEIESKNSIYLNMYLQELADIEALEEQEEIELLMALINGEEYAKKRLTEGWLIKVVELAKNYKDKNVLIEDLIQEGNIGLLGGIESLCGKKEAIDGALYLKESVLLAMEHMIDESMTENDWESTVLAKTNLISEAAKFLAEDLGRVATLKELADYTKIEENEIKDILNLSLDAIKIGEGEEKHSKIQVKKAPKIK
ncbi:RNA polymerase sigma factor region1.1 domain-containing protein [Velocimicrobium porci]|uniref:RNA polymerase sigma-70 domain-containing protein n=1 Tax=Velocimicrobium porci TaxID=2606634 RepID=A0A6L5XX73_9FIRM|nr:hypothetical protein [Velocimicrobium porci]MSS63460.1 hypothetical protein [Velocimicrobium porci]